MMKKLAIGVGFALAASSLGLIMYKIYKKFIQTKLNSPIENIHIPDHRIEQGIEKKDTLNIKKECKINAVSKQELEKICNLWDSIIYQIIRSSKEYNILLQMQIESLNEEEKKEINEKKPERIAFLVSENEKSIIEKNGYDLQEWYEIVENNSHLPEFQKRFEMLNATVIALSEDKEPLIQFQIPSQLDKNTFLNIHRRLYYCYFYHLQLSIKTKIKDNEQNFSEAIEKLKVEINEIVGRTRLEFLKKLGINMQNDILLQNVWLFAVYNFSQDTEISKERENFVSISKYISEKIMKKELITTNYFSIEPEKVSDIEILDVFNSIIKEMGKNQNKSL